MSYRSFKRVLGETNLERKCLILFGACLCLLITGAFWYAERNAEQLVKDKTRQSGQDFVDLSLFRYHIEEHYSPLDATNPQGVPSLLREMDRDLLTQDYQWEILVLSEEGTIDDVPKKKTRLPASEREREILFELQRRLQEQIHTLPPTESPSSPSVTPLPNRDAPSPEGPPVADSQDDPPQEGDDQPIRHLTPVSVLEPRRDKYFYYQPIYWKSSCITCHSVNGAVFLPEHQEPRPELRGPLRVVKVTIPARETQLAMTKSRAILLATAIVTVFLSVTTLYLVVRYVVVKPLNHLRDVSDEISRGNTNLRADIQTNDEFEDLAISFNRMLRHLVDTQEELRRVNADLDAKLDQLAQANMQLHEMNRLKSDFLANMSHELRTPLNSIIGFSDVLSTIESLNEKQKRYVENIGKSGRVLLDMINDILDLAKMESGKMELRLTEFSISHVVKAQADMVRSLSEEKNIDLDVHVPDDLPPVYQDQGKVQQILTNLLSNAIKFTPEGGRVTVSVLPADDEILELIVEDTGVGIADEDREVIFEKFRQGTTVLGGDNLTRKYSGTGLGLSIVKELCKLLGGEVSFESELGKGSRFIVRLPWQYCVTFPIESSLSIRLNDVALKERVGAVRNVLEAAADGTRTGASVDGPSDRAQPSGRHSGSSRHDGDRFLGEGRTDGG